MHVEFTHQELSLLLFALDGGELPRTVTDPCDPKEAACPVVESLEEVFGARNLAPEKKLARHLGQHLRQGWVDCGLLHMIPAEETADPRENNQIPNVMSLNSKLKDWRCEVTLDSQEHDILSGAILRLPRTAWMSMPLMMWRLRRKLRGKHKG
ncbi:MAG TPA: hypothetical protein VJX67_20420 [Blastocatellia bacterium]|nr:hypothetical protein [Blastocatellia bacterium]